MRHYLYLEDRRIAYVCGCFKGGVFTLRAAKTAELTRTGDVQEAAAFLRSAGLAGKSVIAAVEEARPFCVRCAFPRRPRRLRGE